MRGAHILVLLLLAVSMLPAPALGLEEVAEGLERHPLQLPPPPPLAYSRYLNLTGDQLACVSLAVAVYLELSAAVGYSLLGDRDSVEFSGVALDRASMDSIHYLAGLFYLISLDLATGGGDAERLLQDVAYREVSSRLEDLADVLRLSSMLDSNESLAIALMSITPLNTCIDDDPPPQYPIVDYRMVVEASKLLGGLNSSMEAGPEVLANVSLVSTFYTTMLLEKSVDSNETIYRGPPGAGELYLFQLPSCTNSTTAEGWDMLACLIPQHYPTRLHLLPSLLLAQKLASNTWALPLPGEKATSYYETIDKLERFADVYNTLLRSSVVSIQLTPTSEKPDLNLTDLGRGNLTPTNLEEEIKEILRKRRDRIQREEPPPGGEAGGEVEINSSIISQARIRLGDFKNILKGITGLREQISESRISIEGLGRPSPGQPRLGLGTGPEGLGIALPSIPPPLLAIPILVFLGYMAREGISATIAYTRGRVARLTRGRVEAVECYKAALKAVERYGLYKRPDEAPREFLERARPRLPGEHARGLEAATRIYELYKYAGVKPDKRSLDECWRSVRRSILPWPFRRRS